MESQGICDILLEEHRNGSERIVLSCRSNITNNNSNINNETETFYKLKSSKNMSDITILEAKKNAIVKTHKSLFLNISNLQSIDLSQNRIVEISKYFSNLKNLKYLKLDHNNITSIPDIIGDLDKLELFTITNNKIKQIPSSVQNIKKLKILKISNNFITNLPIEIGMLKSIECLHIDANHFTEIPTSLCYLNNLSELSFEWLEFLDPPFPKIIKENIGKTIINLVRNSLQEMLKQNIYFCEFSDFIEKNSNNNNNSSRLDTSNNNISEFEFSKNEGNIENIKLETEKTDINGNHALNNKIVRKINSIRENSNKANRRYEAGTGELNLIHFTNVRNIKIFYAIEKNYFGVIKSLIESKTDIHAIKNIHNKTPLYFAIHNSKTEIINLILAKTDFSKIPNSFIYLHKAIRMTDPTLTERLIDLGVDPNQPDEQGICNIIKN